MIALSRAILLPVSNRVKTFPINVGDYIMNNRDVKKALKRGNVKIAIDGVTEYRYCPLANGYGNYHKVITVDDGGESFYGNGWRGMNVKSYGDKYVYLYSYDLLDNRTKSKVRYSSITFL